MTTRTCHIEVKRDHLSKIAHTSPERGLAELIWNALDADAENVDVYFKPDQLGTLEIVVSDDGTGFSIIDAEATFTALGGSWKALKGTTEGGRRLHGKEGQGRFKAFALGRVVEWTVVAKSKRGGANPPYVIYATADQLDSFTIGDAPPGSRTTHGVTVRITEPVKEYRLFDAEIAVEKLLPLFALYLTTYRNATIRIGGKKLDPDAAIASTTKLALDSVGHNDIDYLVDLEIIEWTTGSERELWLCSANGFPIEQYPKQIRGTGNFGFSAYLRSALFEKLAAEGTLGLGDLSQVLRDVSDVAIRKIKEHFTNRLRELGQDTIQKWKDEAIYPFPQTAASPVEAAEREVFDVVATKVAEHIPTFESSDRKLKAFQLRMLRHAVESGPKELQAVITEVLNLPKPQLDQLSELLRDVSLTGVISASKTVTDRLKFINGLEALLFNNESKRTLKERSQLHKIVAENTWLFGQEFSISVNDQSLTEVLRKHQTRLGGGTMIDEPVKRIDGSIGIVDLMLSRSIPRNRADELEHLVVELKAPKVKIGEKECSQIKSYAYAVIEDERFRGLSAKWHFWIISNDMDNYAERESNQDNRAPGVIYRATDKHDVTVWAKTWSHVLRENRFRLEFVRERLNYEIDRNDALQHLRETYAQFLKGVVIDGETADASADV